MSWVVTQSDNADGYDSESFFEKDQNRELQTQWQLLSRRLFAAESAATPWNGRELWDAFRRSKRRRSLRSGLTDAPKLPGLNP